MIIGKFLPPVNRKVKIFLENFLTAEAVQFQRIGLENIAALHRHRNIGIVLADAQDLLTFLHLCGLLRICSSLKNQKTFLRIGDTGILIHIIQLRNEQIVIADRLYQMVFLALSRTAEIIKRHL